METLADEFEILFDNVLKGEDSVLSLLIGGSVELSLNKDVCKFFYESGKVDGAMKTRIKEQSKIEKELEEKKERELEELERVRKLDRKFVKESMDKVENIATWDWEADLGETIRDKFDNLYNFAKSFVKDGGNKINSMITSPEIFSLFETTRGFKPVKVEFFLGRHLRGTLENGLKGYVDPLFKRSTIFLCNCDDNGELVGDLDSYIIINLEHYLV